MDWVLAKAKFDRGTKMIKAGLDLMDEYLEMVKNGKEEKDLPDMQETIPENEAVASSLFSAVRIKGNGEEKAKGIQQRNKAAQAKY